MLRPLDLADCKSVARPPHPEPPVRERTREHLRGSCRTEDHGFVHMEKDQGLSRADLRSQQLASRALEVPASPLVPAACFPDSFCSTKHGGECDGSFVVEVST